MSDERITFLEADSPIGALWSPVPGLAVAQLGKTLEKEEDIPPEVFAEITRAATGILSQAAEPVGEGVRRTGLVVGYVQSGKTMSMTTVAALARDNLFRMVIVFAGTTKILMSQTRDRFQQHLQPEGERLLWRVLDSESTSALRRQRHQLQSLLTAWRDDTIPDDRKPALMVTVMKNHRHLDALAELLGQVDLTGIPVLVIDDEADQAGLNTKPNDIRPSSTHQHIAAVRANLDHHTYLQYTATPQAPLLISLIDMLSPEFAEVLEAGEGYTGGEAFFGTDRQLAQSIPRNELFKAGDPPTRIPPGLVSALQQFMVAAASLMIQGRMGPWSMLVHPSHIQDDHKAYLRWISRLQSQWVKDLKLPEGERSREVVVDQFRQAYDELATTAADLPAFEEIVHELRLQIGQGILTELNSDSGNEVHWRNGSTHILVGGEKLNRGFTVRGLLCTYMPRSPGGWNADTIQQRARFFGYKATYLSRCRVHLHPDVLTAYRDYVQHERHVRTQLEEFQGRPLTEWKRAFFMDGALHPTRRYVLSDPYYKLRQRQSWLYQRYPHDNAIRERNRDIVDQFLLPLEFSPYWDDGRHLSAVLELRQVLHDLLVPIAVIGRHDVRWMYAARVWIEEIVRRHPGAQARVLVMDGGRPDDSARVRRRSVESSGTRESKMLKEIPQGRDHKELGNYPGDRKMHDRDRVTVQLHRLQVQANGRVIDGVWALGVRIPQQASQPLPSVVVRPEPDPR